MSKLNYKTSKDYKRLKELLGKGEMIIVLWEESPYAASGELVQKVHAAQKVEDYYYIGAAFCWAERFSTSFEYQCERYGIEFIEPNGEE